MENQNRPVDENASEWQAPPPPPVSPQSGPEEEPPRMSEAGTLGSIFFEPGETFDDLRRKPRFIFALLITIVLITGFTLLFYNKLGDERLRRSVVEQTEKNPQFQSLSPEQKQQQISVAFAIAKYSQYAFPLFIIIGAVIGALIYWAGGKAMGGTGNFLHALSIWVYSTFAPAVISMLANIVVLFLKSPDDMDINSAQRGLVQANPSFLFDGKETPVLTTLISTLDLFMIWGWVLAAIGFQRVMRLSSGAAWGLVVIIALIGVAFRVFSALMSGNPM